MRKSVIKSMILCSVSVVLISFLLLTSVFVYNVRSDLIDESYSDMDHSINRIIPVVSTSMDYSTGKMFELFDIAMRQFIDTHKYHISILTSEGDMVWRSDVFSESEVKPYNEQLLLNLEGKEHIHSGNAFNKLYGSKTLTTAHKVYNNSKTKTWIITCTVITPGILSRYMDIVVEVMLMEFVAIIFIVIFMYLFSRSITNPLRKINKAVKEFSHGNFDKRVHYSTPNELGELAENINLMADSIQNTEKIRSAFISDISHELRTPMTTISGFIEGILDGTIKEEDRDKYLSIVLSESKRLSRLVNDLLGVSRLENNSQDIVKNEFDVCELVKIVLLKFEREISEKNLQVIFESDSDQINVLANYDSITRVLINLIHNAVKFSQESGYIKLSLEQNSDKCIITIENSGPGIAEDKLNYIWQRFYKVDDSRSTDTSGIGLGLYIVKKIIDAHDEKITVESIPDKLTKFSFTLELGYNEIN